MQLLRGRRRGPAVVFLALLWAIGSGLPGLPGLSPGAWAQAEPEDGAVVLPLTIEKVWYRAGEKKGLAGLRVFKAKGDVTLTREGLEFHGGKDSFAIPLANIAIVSLGKIGRDVDTDWVVLGLREGGLERVIAFKDGKALGYGQDTPEIYRKIRSAMKLLGGAQYDVPDGYHPYVVIDDQVGLMVPDGWSVSVPAAVTIDGRTPWGTHVFSSSDLGGGREILRSDAIRKRVADTATREYFLVRQEIGAGMSCSGFKAKALSELLESAALDPLFEGEFQLTEPPRSTPLTIAGCEGLRVVARGRRADGLEAVLDLRVVARRDTLFKFGVRAPTSDHEGLLAVFEPVVAGARFAAAID